MTETRDFLIGGQSYRDLSTRAIGRAVEPHTTIEDVPDLLAQFPDLSQLVPSRISPTMGFVVTIGGTTLPDAGTGEVALKAGYHREVETFVFRFALPPRPGA